MGRHARETRGTQPPEGTPARGDGRRMSRWRRRFAVGVAVLGLAATVVAGMDLFAMRPRVDRFFAPGAAPGVSGGRASATAPAPAHSVKSASRPAPRPAPEALIQPVPGRVVLGYGWAYSPAFAEWRFHAAVDLAARPGQPVVAAAAGKVTAVRTSRLFGDVVDLDVGGGEDCTYEGLGNVDVRVGQRVRAGQALGVVGPSPAAEASEPPHIHWQVSRNGKPVNPERLTLYKLPPT